MLKILLVHSILSTVKTSSMLEMSKWHRSDTDMFLPKLLEVKQNQGVPHCVHNSDAVGLLQALLEAMAFCCG